MGTPIRVLEPKEIFIILQVRKLRLKSKPANRKPRYPTQPNVLSTLSPSAHNPNSKEWETEGCPRRPSFASERLDFRETSSGDPPIHCGFFVFVFCLIFREQNNSFDWETCELWYKDHERGVWTLRSDTCNLVQKNKRESESNQSVLFNQVLRQYGVVESTRLPK